MLSGQATIRVALVCTPNVDSTLRLAAQMEASDVVARDPARLGRTLDDVVAQAEGHGLTLSIAEGHTPHGEFTHGREVLQLTLHPDAPPPRKHRHRYHGVFAPNHKLRQAVMARVGEEFPLECLARQFF